MHKTIQASLPMYDFPELRTVTDEWWRGIKKHFQHAGITIAPEELLHDRPVHELWNDDKLLLSQCCGFDVAFGYRDLLAVLVTPVYAVAGCENGHYMSRIVVHAESGLQDLAALKGKVAAINGPESHSGMNAFLSLIQPLSDNGRFFREIRVSGAHADSIRMVQQKQVDVAAIDCVTYALLERYRPAVLQDVITIAKTDVAPALPYVTRKAIPPEQQEHMREALLAAFVDPALIAVREALLLQDAVVQPPDFYRRIAEHFSFDQRLLDVVV
ncbi:MAG: phosphate/phosphite/phosphonate ABC transporter substrate-binding protein [Thiolinea sp.]